MSNFGINIGSRRSRNVITPTFSRDFATNKTLNHGVGPNITFTRSSSATFLTSTGTLSTVPNNVPRFDHGNIRTNLLTNSEAFDLWSGSATVSGNVVDIVAPNDTFTADKITFTSSNRQTRFNTFTPLPSSPYTVSVYMKADSSIQVRILMDQTCSAFATATFCDVTTDWQRFTLTYPGFPTNVNAAFGIDNVTDNLSACTGTYQSGIVYVWGAQAETGLSATPYIPTTTTSVTTGDSLGVLIEESRSNLLLRSGNFDTIEWSKINATATAEILGPDGTISGYKLEATNTTDVEVKQTAIATGTSMTFSVYLKAATGPTTGNVVQLRNNTTTTSLLTVRVHLGTGTITYTNGSSGATATNVGNGWWRIALTANSGITAGDTIQCSVLDNFLSTMSVGDSVYAWGAQLERGAFPTSYITTAGTSATRLADDARISSINTNSFFNQEQGTVFMEAEYVNGRLGAPAAPGWWTIDTGAFAVGYGLLYGGTPQLNFYTRSSGVNTITNISTFPINTPNLTRTACTISPTQRTMFYNGNFAGTNTTPYAFSPLTTFRIGANYIAGNPPFNFFGGYIRKITYWPTRLSNNRLRLLTF